ncbi:acetyl-CoA synthetase-like protein [Rhizoclosmatium globosum]|uniref:Acetyl-CoA synthetase-like protein n=1 Tax=Rhizoclosmatium globosum TaxID=329046 RepID=A0A1Y2BK91_9FUNG|nr:acetyl-CoA synthetase-like protein [Rhizoclosmatium globosum]|eukprot:ORY35184.1 acetyl-CoA synthetase-like protein [Rhizoclosmatium globosum]
MIQVASTAQPDRKMFGQRRILNIIEEQKEVVKKRSDGTESTEMQNWKFYELGPFEWLTWREADQIIRNYASALKALGLNPGDKFTTYAETSRDWMFIALACFHRSITLTTAYATLGEDGLLYSLQETESYALFTNAELLPMVSKILSKCPHIKAVIYNGAARVEDINALQSRVRLLSLSDFEELGAANTYECIPPKSEDLAVIMYTSGSTGAPKGVSLTHGNIVASVTAIYLEVIHHRKDDDVFAAFLPQAHVFGFVAELLVLYGQVPIGYCSTKTLSDDSVRNCKGDLAELKPTIINGVPAVWEAIRKKVTGKVALKSWASQTLFWTSFKIKSWLIQHNLRVLSKPLDMLVFSKVLLPIGGRFGWGCVAGAAVPASTAEFMAVALGKIFKAYGMTEAAGGCSILQTLETCHLPGVGAPSQTSEVKLVDCPELGYKVSNRPKPQGEVYVRGFSVSKGYYKRPDLTAEAFDEDGWLKTGDIAELNENGTFTIIDRKKNLIKLSNGEYVALEKLEANYKVSKYVQNICIHADMDQSYIVALIQPVEKEIRALAGQLAKTPGLDTDNLDYQDLCSRQDILDYVVKDLQNIAKQVGFVKAEVITRAHLCHEEWTPQNTMLTAAMKLNRKNIVRKFEKEVERMY